MTVGFCLVVRRLVAAALLVGLFVAAPSSSTAQSPTPKKLPWAKPESSPIEVVGRKPTSARELLVNVDESQIMAFIDGRSLVLDEEESLIRVLSRLPKFGISNVETLARTVDDWQAFASEPDKHRIEIYKLAGRVQNVERSVLLPEQQDRFDFGVYYRVTLQLEDSPYRATICTHQVPEAWKTAKSLDEQASVLGLFLKTGDQDGEHPELVFVSQRIAWHPSRANPELGILPDHVLLGQLKMDVGLFDDVRGVDEKKSRNGKDISSEESECFYQLLAAVRKTSQQELDKHVTKKFDLPALLQRPRDHHGQLMSVVGNARRITRITVDSPEFQQRFGLDHYYEVYVFVSLGDVEIRLAGDKNDKHAPVINNAFPVAFCVPRLPPEWSKFATGSDDLHQRVRITGFNFKLWAYHTQMLQHYVAEQIDRTPPAGFDAKAPRRRPLQPSPLFIGADIEFLPPEESSTSTASAVAIFGLILIFTAVGGTVLTIWWLKRGERKLQAAVNQRRAVRNAAQGDSPETGLPDKPDFSGMG